MGREISKMEKSGGKDVSPLSFSIGAFTPNVIYIANYRDIDQILKLWSSVTYAVSQSKPYLACETQARRPKP